MQNKKKHVHQISDTNIKLNERLTLWTSIWISISMAWIRHNLIVDIKDMIRGGEKYLPMMHYFKTTRFLNPGFSVNLNRKWTVNVKFYYFSLGQPLGLWKPYLFTESMCQNGNQIHDKNVPNKETSDLLSDICVKETRIRNLFATSCLHSVLLSLPRERIISQNLEFPKVPCSRYAYYFKCFIMHWLHVKIILVFVVILPKVYPSHVATNI